MDETATRAKRAPRARRAGPMPIARVAALLLAVGAASLFQSRAGRPCSAGSGIAGRHRGKAGGARDRRRRRVRRALRRGRRSGDPLPCQRLSGSDPFQGWRHRQEGRPAAFTIDRRPYQAAFDAAKSQLDVATACSNSPRPSSRVPRRCPNPAIWPLPCSMTDAARTWLPKRRCKALPPIGARQPQSRVHRDQGTARRAHRPPF